jgi:Lipocalin-like domain
MKRSAVPTIIVLAILSLAVGVFAGAAVAQQKTLKEQLVGTWTFVSSSGKLADGSPVWGSNPKGIVIFTDDGHYSSHIVRADVPKFAAKNRLQGTPEENKAAVHGGAAQFGTYTVNEANKSFTLRIEGSSYPNNTGTEQTRPFTISGDELKVINPASSAGGQSELVYKRAK